MPPPDTPMGYLPRGAPQQRVVQKSWLGDAGRFYPPEGSGRMRCPGCSCPVWFLTRRGENAAARRCEALSALRSDVPGAEAVSCHCRAPGALPKSFPPCPPAAGGAGCRSLPRRGEDEGRVPPFGHGPAGDDPSHGVSSPLGAPDGALHIPQALLEISPGTQSLNPAVPKLMKVARGAAVIAPVPAPSRSTGQVTAPNAPRPKPGGLIICTPRGETPGKRHFCSEKPPAVGALARFGLCR